MDNFLFLFFALLLFAGFLVYFKVARKYNIVDVPNHRTMHEGATIRGGGVVIFMAMVLFSIFIYNPGYYFLAGLIIIGITGFLDDLLDLPNRIRFPLQLLSVVLMIWQSGLGNINLSFLIAAVIIITGTLNAFNFMDGINGITAGYAMVSVGTLLYINNTVQPFIYDGFLWFFMLALLVFSFFNFRKKAVCFAGDVGSLSVAFVVVFLLLKLITVTGQWIYVLFLTLYGIDTIFTIIQRIFRKENIFRAHRLHFFQVVIKKTGMAHLQMTGFYMAVQLAVNIIILKIAQSSWNRQIIYALIMLGILSLFYIYVKSKMMRRADAIQ